MKNQRQDEAEAAGCVCVREDSEAKKGGTSSIVVFLLVMFTCWLKKNDRSSKNTKINHTRENT